MNTYNTPLTLDELFGWTCTYQYEFMDEDGHQVYNEDGELFGEIHCVIKGYKCYVEDKWPNELIILIYLHPIQEHDLDAEHLNVLENEGVPLESLHGFSNENLLNWFKNKKSIIL